MSDRWSAGLAEMLRRDGTRAPERNAFYDLVAARALALFALSGRVLDVGCGSGWVRRRRSGTIEYFGIDPCRPADWDAEQFAFVRGVAESLPFPDATFEGVLSYSMLQHVEEPEAVLQEIARVLNPGGRLALMMCVESQDPLFLQSWTAGKALQVVGSYFALDAVAAIPGYQPEDGYHLCLRGVKPEIFAPTYDPV